MTKTFSSFPMRMAQPLLAGRIPRISTGTTSFFINSVYCSIFENTSLVLWGKSCRSSGYSGTEIRPCQGFTSAGRQAQRCSEGGHSTWGDTEIHCQPKASRAKIPRMNFREHILCWDQLKSWREGLRAKGK